jgi:hypothetical protein
MIYHYWRGSMKNLTRIARLALVLAALAGTYGRGQSLFCRRSEIEGQSGPAGRAKSCLPGTTSDVAKMAIYIGMADPEAPSMHDLYAPDSSSETRRRFDVPWQAWQDSGRVPSFGDSSNSTSLYVHSNYVTHGFDYPTKVLTPERIQYAANLVPSLMGQADFKAAGISLENLESVHLPVKLFVEQAVLENYKYGQMNLAGFEQLFVVGRDGRVREAAILESDSGQIAIRYHNSLFAKPSVDDASRLFGRLREEPLNRDKVRLLLLVTNTDTEQAAEAIPGSNRIKVDLHSKDDWRTKLSRQANTTVVVLGHAEDGAFVVLDAEQNELLRIELDELESLAKSNGIDLIALGCNTAAVTSFTGVDSKFNTVDAVKRVATALNARTKLDFLDALAPKPDDIKIVLDREAMQDDKREMQMTIFSGSGAASLAVASVVLTGIGAALGEPIDKDSEYYIIPVAGIGLGVGTVFWWRRRRQGSLSITGDHPAASGGDGRYDGGGRASVVWELRRR